MTLLATASLAERLSDRSPALVPQDEAPEAGTAACPEPRAPYSGAWKSSIV